MADRKPWQNPRTLALNDVGHIFAQQRKHRVVAVDPAVIRATPDQRRADFGENGATFNRDAVFGTGHDLKQAMFGILLEKLLFFLQIGRNTTTTGGRPALRQIAYEERFGHEGYYRKLQLDAGFHDRRAMDTLT